MASETWQTRTLGEVLELKRGYDLPSRDRRDGPFPIVSSSGVSGFHSSAMAKAPGVVTGRYGTLGQVFFIETDYWPLNTALYVRDFKGNDPRFVSYFLKTLDFMAYSDKAAVPGLNRNHLHMASVELPPLPKQRAIAGVLGALDDKIEVNRKTARVLEGIARAVFTSWFVDFDPVRYNIRQREHAALGRAGRFVSTGDDFTRRDSSGHLIRPDGDSVYGPLAHLFPNRLVDSAIGEVPDGWDTVALYDTAQYINGAAFRSEHFCDRPVGLPVIKIAELKGGITNQTEHSNRRDLDAKYLIDTGELLYSWSGSPDTSLDVFLWTKGPGFLNQHIFKVVTAGPAQKHFVYYLLRHLRNTLVETARNKQTTGLGHVTVADMKKIRVCHPPDVVLSAFDRLIGPIFDRCFEIAMESETLAAVRDTLLPKLISGELRIADAEKIVGRTT